jgi:hypothetical protein
MLYLNQDDACSYIRVDTQSTQEGDVTLNQLPIGSDAIIEAVLTPNPSLPCTELHNMGQTRVFKVDTPEPVVVRIITGNHPATSQQLEILKAIDTDVTARILHCETRPVGAGFASIQIQTYLPGAPLQHYPSAEEALVLAEATYLLHGKLIAASNEFAAKGILRLSQISEGLMAVAEDSPMKKEALQLFNNDRYRELISKEKQVLTYGDPWIQNYLFDFSEGGPTVRIVDVDPVMFGPKVLQPAMLFSAYHVISFLKHTSDGASVLNLDELIGHWPEPIDRQDVLLMMQVYPILLSLKKKIEFTGTSQAEWALHHANIELLGRCLEVVQRLR